MPPTLMFGEADFVLLDLDRGISCEHYVEQDECVVAIFRDCTDQGATIPRSWQGSISHTKVLSLARTNETTSGGVSARSPVSCTGPVNLEGTGAAKRAWASLECRLPMGAHGGFYIEEKPRPATPAIAPFAHLDASRKTRVVDVLADGEEIRGFGVSRSTGEIWALLGGRAGGARVGVYRGPATGGRLSRMSVAVTMPSNLTFSADGRTAYVVDGTRLLAIDAANAGVVELEATAPILQVGAVAEGLLVAVRQDDGRTVKSVVTLRDPTTLAPRRGPETIDGEIAGIIPLPRSVTSSIALLRFARQSEVAFLLPSLQASAPIPLGSEPRVAVVMPERRKVGFGLRDDRGATYVEIELGARISPIAPTAVRFPGTEIRAALWDAGRARLVLALRTGAILEYDPEAHRPFLQRQLMLPTPASALAAGSSSTAFALFPTTGEIAPLVE